jgi:hypothetical protein
MDRLPVRSPESSGPFGDAHQRDDGAGGGRHLGREGSRARYPVVRMRAVRVGPVSPSTALTAGCSGEATRDRPVPCFAAGVRPVHGVHAGRLGAIGRGSVVASSCRRGVDRLERFSNIRARRGHEEHEDMARSGKPASQRPRTVPRRQERQEDGHFLALLASLGACKRIGTAPRAVAWPDRHRESGPRPWISPPPSWPSSRLSDRPPCG